MDDAYRLTLALSRGEAVGSNPLLGIIFFEHSLHFHRKDVDVFNEVFNDI